MWVEDAVRVSVWGVEVYRFGLFAALGAAACLLVLKWTLDKRSAPRGTAALCGVFMLLLGAALARLLYMFTDASLRAIPSFQAFIHLETGGYSMFGALTGAVLGCLAGGKLTKVKAGDAADCAAPALAAFVLFERLGEKGTGLGHSRTLMHAPLFSFLTVQGEYGQYLATFYLEAGVALILLCVLLWDFGRKRRRGDTALAGLLLFGCTQVVLESLRFDRHMRFSFISVQQILAFVCVCASIIVFSVRALRCGKRALPVFSLVYLALLMGALILIEFAIDRSGVDNRILYAIYVALAAVPCVTGLKMRAVTERTEKNESQRH